MSNILFSWQKSSTRCWLTTGCVSLSVWPRPQSSSNCLEKNTITITVHKFHFQFLQSNFTGHFHHCWINRNQLYKMMKICFDTEHFSKSYHEIFFFDNKTCKRNSLSSSNWSNHPTNLQTSSCRLTWVPSVWVHAAGLECHCFVPWAAPWHRCT